MRGRSRGAGEDEGAVLSPWEIRTLVRIEEELRRDDPQLHRVLSPRRLRLSAAGLPVWAQLPLVVLALAAMFVGLVVHVGLAFAAFVALLWAVHGLTSRPPTSTSWQRVRRGLGLVSDERSARRPE